MSNIEEMAQAFGDQNGDKLKALIDIELAKYGASEHTTPIILGVMCRVMDLSVDQLHACQREKKLLGGGMPIQESIKLVEQGLQLGLKVVLESHRLSLAAAKSFAPSGSLDQESGDVYETQERPPRYDVN